MTVEKLEGTSPRLYALVAPLIMRRSVLRQNNNYPFWTSPLHEWFVASEGGVVSGFVPVEMTVGGTAKINNYHVAGDDAELLGRMLDEVLRCCGEGLTVRAVVHTRHAGTFEKAGFKTVMKWKLYVKMERAAR